MGKCQFNPICPSYSKNSPVCEINQEYYQSGNYPGCYRNFLEQSAGFGMAAYNIEVGALQRRNPIRTVENEVFSIKREN